MRKSDDKTRGKVKTYGLMPSELNKLNQSVYHADAEAIRGARDTESALRYIPFITIVNTAGFGQQFDLRGQGRLSANGVKFLINGISFNPIDSYYGFMPINSVLPSLIQEVAVYPSAGARGGSINVITSKRFERPYFEVGAGYAGTLATTGTSYNAYAQAAEKFGALNLNVGAGYFQKGGPREDDSSSGFEGVLGAAYSFALGQSVVFDADFYSAKEKTTPYNSFFDSEKVNALFKEYQTKYGAINDATQRLELEKEYGGKILALPSYSPSKDDRKTAGAGEIETTHQRFAGSLGYENEVTQKLKTTLTGFYAFSKRKYDIYKSSTQLYSYLGRYFIGTSDNPNQIDQSGSSFDEQKFGLKAQIDWTHDNGQLLAGLESIFETAKRNPLQHLRTSRIDTSNTNSVFQWLEFNINTPLDITQWTNAVFFLEKYDLTDSFSLRGGVRYQMTKSNLDASGEINARMVVQGLAPSKPTTNSLSKSLEINHDNFAFEFTPAFRYSDTGVVYGRYERGFSPVPAYAMLQRTGGFALNTGTDAATNPFTGSNFEMSETQLNDESYNSYEIGFKDYVAQRQIYLGSFNLTIDALLFSANVFYTDSKNEFYFDGDPYSGLSYKTYDKSRRIGAEVALEQYFFGGGLGLNESFTYLKAQSQNADGKWTQIPYTYDYKATFGINAQVPVGRFVDVRLWLQNSFYGKQAVIGLKDEKIDPYLISDVGVSFGFNKGAAVLTAGVKNVLDTFYYDYYNNNKAASIGEYRYLLGQGRTIFVEGTYRY